MFSVELNLGGEVREIKVTYNTLCLVERVSGLSLLMNTESWASATFLRDLVWAALHHGSIKAHATPDIQLFAAQPDLDTVGEWIDDAGPAIVLGKMFNAWSIAMPETDGEEAKEDDEPSDPTQPPVDQPDSPGKSSGPTPGSN